MAVRGTAVVLVEVEDHLLAKMVFHLPITADLLPNSARNESVLQWNHRIMKLWNDLSWKGP